VLGDPLAMFALLRLFGLLHTRKSEVAHLFGVDDNILSRQASQTKKTKPVVEVIESKDSSRTVQDCRARKSCATRAAPGEKHARATIDSRVARRGTGRTETAAVQDPPMLPALPAAEVRPRFPCDSSSTKSLEKPTSPTSADDLLEGHGLLENEDLAASRGQASSASHSQSKPHSSVGPVGLSWADMGSDSEMDFDEPLIFDDDLDDWESKPSKDYQPVLLQLRDDLMSRARVKARAETLRCLQQALLTGARDTARGVAQCKAGLPGMPEQELSPLHHEILHHVQAIDSIMAAQAALRRQLVVQVHSVVVQLWPCAFVREFGSMYGPPQSCTALPSSDLDLVVCGLPPRSPQCSDATLLMKLRARLQGSGSPLVSSNIVDTPVASVLRLVLADAPCSLDITLDSTRHGGLRKSEFIRSSCERSPGLRPLLLVVKHLLHHWNLVEPFHGGLGGYAISLLTLRCLGDFPEQTDLGVLLRHMLRFLGGSFDAQTMGIRVRAGESYLLCGEGDTRPWGCQPIFIEDPLERGNNVGMSAWRFPEIQQVFMQSAQILESCSLDSLWACQWPLVEFANSLER